MRDSLRKRGDGGGGGHDFGGDGDIEAPVRHSGETGATSSRVSSLTVQLQQVARKHAWTIAGLSLLFTFVTVTSSLHRSISLHRQLVRGLAEVRALEGTGLAPDYIPILMPVYGRPEYLKQTVLVVSQDGANEEITELINGIDFMPVVHLHHTQPYWNIPSHFIRSDFTTASNVFFLLRWAFDYAHARAAIVLESDLEPGVDFYQYFLWTAQALEDDAELRKRVFTVNGYVDSKSPSSDPYAFQAKDFTVWGWMCPAHRWAQVKQGWTWFHNWDIQMEHGIRQRHNLVSLGPALSRVRNIGMSGINFDVMDDQEKRKWQSVHLSDKAIDYTGRSVTLP